MYVCVYASKYKYIYIYICIRLYSVIEKVENSIIFLREPNNTASTYGLTLAPTLCVATRVFRWHIDV